MGALDKYIKLFKDLESKTADVGWFPSSNYLDDDTGKITPVAEVAMKNEFGFGIIPARPFMRPTIAAEKVTWGLIAKSLINEDAQANDVLEAVGLRMGGDIFEKIASITSPPLAPMTLELRRERGNNSNKPLNDTGYMMATLAVTVENKTIFVKDNK